MRASSNISGKTTGAPIPSTKLGWYGTSTGSPAFSDGASGAAVETSAANTRAAGERARIAEAIPQLSPPPPYGTTTASSSGRSSSTSSPIVPLPAITCRSLNGWTNAPRRPGNAREPNTPSHSSNVTEMTLAPRRSVAERFAWGAVSGITTVAGMLLRRAYHATAWAMFPALAVHTPSATSSSASDSMSEPAPRILNDPIGCRTSSFR